MMGIGIKLIGGLLLLGGVLYLVVGGGTGLKAKEKLRGIPEEYPEGTFISSIEGTPQYELRERQQDLLDIIKNTPSESRDHQLAIDELHKDAAHYGESNAEINVRVEYYEELEREKGWDY